MLAFFQIQTPACTYKHISMCSSCSSIYTTCCSTSVWRHLHMFADTWTRSTASHEVRGTHTHTWPWMMQPDRTLGTDIFALGARTSAGTVTPRSNSYRTMRVQQNGSRMHTVVNCLILEHAANYLPETVQRPYPLMAGPVAHIALLFRCRFLWSFFFFFSFFLELGA